tara:strand:- start:368 stop:739 length:372 start_codon:yes stop_codon:yes gene_type:complete
MEKEGKIYKLINNINDLVYIGSSSQKYLSKRKAAHKESFLGKGGRNPLSSNKIFQGENCKVSIVLLELVRYTDRHELFARERFHYDQYECVNKYVPNRTGKEWKLENKDKIKQQLSYRKKYKK